MTQDVKKLSDDLLKEIRKQPLTKPMIDQFSKEAKKAEAQAINQLKQAMTRIATSLFLPFITQAVIHLKKWVG